MLAQLVCRTLVRKSWFKKQGSVAEAAKHKVVRHRGTAEGLCKENKSELKVLFTKTAPRLCTAIAIR